MKIYLLFFDKTIKSTEKKSNSFYADVTKW